MGSKVLSVQNFRGGGGGGGANIFQKGKMPPLSSPPTPEGCS